MQKKLSDKRFILVEQHLQKDLFWDDTFTFCFTLSVYVVLIFSISVTSRYRVGIFMDRVTERLGRSRIPGTRSHPYRACPKLGLKWLKINCQKLFWKTFVCYQYHKSNRSKFASLHKSLQSLEHVEYGITPYYINRAY